jgi:predicted DNA-binding transcriptional regulator AlpA
MSLLRFRDLKSRGIVSNHVTLKRWIEHEGFPPGLMLGPNTRAWRESEVEAWLDSRPTDNTLLRGAAKRDERCSFPLPRRECA